MKLARKLTLWLVLGIASVMSVHSALAIRREQSFLEADSQRHNQLLGRTLAALISEVIRADGEPRALRLIAQANEHDPFVSFRWVLLDPTREELAHKPEVRRSRLDAVAEGHEVVELQRLGDAAHLVTYVPFTTATGRAAAIEVAQSLAEKQRYVRSMIATSIATTIVLALVAIGIAIATGAWVVGRPMRALAAKARRIGEGDLGSPLELAQDDEVGELAREMNRMCTRLADAQAALAQATSARIAALEQLRHAERLAVVGKLASGIAHELGTPLQVVSGWAKMIRAREIEGDEVGAAAGAIAEQSERMAQSIRGLLDFARRRDTSRQLLDVRDLVRDTLSLLQPLAEKRSIVVTLDERGEPGRVRADAGQLQQALTNLVVNGFDALPNGGALAVTIDRAREAPPAEIGHQATEFVRIAVRDEGEGIDLDDLPHVFDPFFTTKAVGHGTGLGLPVARDIVREHLGWIDVRSERGRGSTFTIHLPLEEAECSDAS